MDLVCSGRGVGFRDLFIGFFVIFKSLGFWLFKFLDIVDMECLFVCIF